MVNAEKYRDLIIEIFKEENYIKVNELIRGAKIIK